MSAKHLLEDGIDRRQVEALLYAELGPLRAWSDFLADSTRGKASFFGLQLEPICYAHVERGRCPRPVYSMADVRAFIDEAIERGAVPMRPTAPHLVRVEIDAEALALLPAMRRGRLVH